MTSEVLAEVKAAVAVVDDRAATALAVLEDGVARELTPGALVAAPDEPAPQALVAAPDEPLPGTPVVAEALRLFPVEDEPPSAPDRPARRRRIWWRVAAISVVAVAVVGVQLGRPVPVPAVHVSLAKLTGAGIRRVHIPWPSTGEAAVAVPATETMLQSGTEAPVPIASLAKVMTAYVILHDHPLVPGAGGPGVTLTAVDQANASADQAANATAVPVQAGEVLSERQLLDGLLVHSANNFADVLARWDAGSLPAFVAKMNATGLALGMQATHYADASGLDNNSVGTAVDELRVATAAMAVPTFAAVVAQPAVSLPVAGRLPNYVTAVGTDGVVGVKSGFTQAAMGCLVLAADRTVGGRDVLVLAVVTGQPAPDPLGRAQRADLALVDAVPAALRPVSIVARDATVARVTVPWGAPVRATADRSVSAILWPNEALHETFSARPVRPGEGAGSEVGTLSVSVGGQHVVVAVRLASSIGRPSLVWRLAHG